MKQKYNLIPKKLELTKREIQEYWMDENPKSNFAEYRKTEKKICVNKKFEELPIKERIAILYHERGHSNFYLLAFFYKIAHVFLVLFVFGTLIPLMFLIFNQFPNTLLFNIPNLIWISVIIASCLSFIIFVIINYFLEIIADIYSVSKTNDLTIVKCVKDLYWDKENKKTWWKKYILHPSPNLREKIARKILKW